MRIQRTAMIMFAAMLLTSQAHSVDALTDPAENAKAPSTDGGVDGTLETLGSNGGVGTAQKANAQNGWEGRWGMGLGLGVEFYNDRYIQEASIRGAGNTVVVDKSYESQSAFWAVGTWTVDNCENMWGGRWIRNLTCSGYHRPGFFFGAKIGGGEDGPLEGVAFGPQMSWVEPVYVTDSSGKEEKVSKATWSFGIGWVNHAIKHMPPDIVDGQPLPSKYDDIVFQEETENSWMVMISRNLK